MTPSLHLKLTNDEALVLFELLARRSDNWKQLGIDAAELKVLWKLEGLLESRLAEIVHPDYLNLVAAAKSRLLSNGGA